MKAYGRFAVEIDRRIFSRGRSPSYIAERSRRIPGYQYFSIAPQIQNETNLVSFGDVV